VDSAPALDTSGLNQYGITHVKSHMVKLKRKTGKSLNRLVFPKKQKSQEIYSSQLNRSCVHLSRRSRESLQLTP
jgi:hypothetical protein